MSFDTSSYSSLGRRTPSYSFSSGSSRSSFSSDYGSSSSHGFSPGFSSLGSTTSLSTCGLSGSLYSSRPPSSSSFSSHSSREGSFLSASMMKRDTIINSLVRNSHELTRHDFLPSDAASRSCHISHLSYRAADRSRSKTTDMSLSSLTARSTSDFGCFSSFPTASNYGTAYRSPYQPILIQRPSFDNYTPRPREERLKDTPFKSIRRDRPLVKFREKEEVNADKFRQLLDSWSPETIEEQEDEDYETKKRDSVRSNDSGIGSFRSSFGKRSRKKSGEFLGYDLSPTIDEKDSGTEDNEDLNSDRRHGRYTGVDHISSVDEGVHMEAEYESRSPRDIVSPLGFQDNNSRPLSRNDVSNTFEKEYVHSVIVEQVRSKNTESSNQREEQHPSSPENKPPVAQRFSSNNRVRRRSDLDSYEALENTVSDVAVSAGIGTLTGRRRDVISRSNLIEGERPKISEKFQTNKDETEKIDSVLSKEPKTETTVETESFRTCVPETEIKTKMMSPNTSILKNSGQSNDSPSDQKYTAKTEITKSRETAEKLASERTDEKFVKKKKHKTDEDENIKIEIPDKSLPSPSKTSLPETASREKGALNLSSGIMTSESLKNTTDANKLESSKEMPVEPIGKTVIGKLGKMPFELASKIEMEKSEKKSPESVGKRTAETPNIVPAEPFSKVKLEWTDKTKIEPLIENTTSKTKTGTESSSKDETESRNKTSAESSAKPKIKALRTETTDKSPVERSNKTDKIAGESSKKKQIELSAEISVETSNSVAIGSLNETKIEPRIETKIEAPEEQISETLNKPFASSTNKMAVESPSKLKGKPLGKSPIDSTSKPKLESLNKTTDPRSKTKVESLGKTALDSTNKTESLSKKALDSSRRLKVDSLSKVATDAADKTKVESLGKTTIDSPIKTEVKSLSKTPTDSPNKTESLRKIAPDSSSKPKVESLSKTANDSPSKTKVELLSKTTVDSPSKTKVDSLSKVATDAANKTKVDSLGKTTIDSPIKTEVKSLSKTTFDSPSKTQSLSKTAPDSSSKPKAESVSKTTIDSPSKTKVEFLSKTTVDSTVKTESLSKPAPDSSSKPKVESLMQTAVDSSSKTESLSKTTVDSPSKTTVGSLSKVATDSANKTMVDSLSKITTNSSSKPEVESSIKPADDSPSKEKLEPFSETTAESSDKTKIESTGKLAVRDIPGENNSALDSDVKSPFSQQTENSDVRSIMNDKKPKNEEENLKDENKLAKDTGEITGAIPKTKRERLVKTDTLTFGKDKRGSVDPGKILPSNKEEQQLKCLESSQTQEVNEIKSKSSSPKAENSVSLPVNEISLKNEKVISKTSTAAKSETDSSKPKLFDNKTDKDITSEKDINIWTEKTATACTDPQKFNSEATDIMTPLRDSKLLGSKEETDLRDTEGKDTFNTDQLKETAEKDVPSSEEKHLKDEKRKELPLETGNKTPSEEKDTDKDTSLHGIEKGVPKDFKQSPETEDSTTDMKTQKQITTFTSSLESNEDSKAQDIFPTPSEVRDVNSEEILSASEKSLITEITSEKSVNELRKKVDSTRDFEQQQKDAKFCNTDERKKSVIQEISINDGLHDIKENVDSGTNKIGEQKEISLPEAKICASDTEEKSKEQLPEKLTKESTYQLDDKNRILDIIPSTVETSETKFQTKCKPVAFGITKSLSEDFRHDDSVKTCENFKLQKSSSADTKILKRTKPPLPVKTVIPPGLPIPHKKRRASDDYSSEENRRLLKLQKSSTDGKINFKSESNEKSKLFDLKKSSTVGKIKLKADSSESLKLEDLKTSDIAECLAKKPSIKDTKLLSESSQANQEKIQTAEDVTSIQNSVKSNESAHQIPFGNKNSEIEKEVLKPREVQTSEENIPKESSTVVSAKSSTTEDRDGSSPASEVCEVAPGNEVKTETVKDEIQASAAPVIQEIASVRPEDINTAGLGIPAEAAKELPSKEFSDAVTKKDEPRIPTPKTARSDVPKNTSGLPESETDVPIKHFVPSSSASVLAIEKVRAKIAKQTELENLLKARTEKILGKSARGIKEKDKLSTAVKVNDSSVSQDKAPQGQKKIRKEISKADTGKNDAKGKPEIASESVIASQGLSKFEEICNSNKTQSNVDKSTRKKTKGEKEMPSGKEDSYSSAVTDNKNLHYKDNKDLNDEKENIQNSLENNIFNTKIKDQVKGTTNTTQTVEVGELNKDSTQKSEQTTVHTEQRATEKVLGDSVQSEQISVIESSPITTETEQSNLVTAEKEQAVATAIPTVKERPDHDKAGVTVSNALPPRKDTEDSVALDTTVTSEEIKPKVKKPKKPKAEGEEKVKKKKKKEKSEVAEKKSDTSSKTETVQPPTNENAASAKTCEVSLASEGLQNAAAENIHSKQNSNLSTPSSGVNNEASATTDTYSVNICNLTPPQSPAISDPEDVCDHLWSENKRSESSESIRQSRNSSVNTIRFRKYTTEDFHFLKVLGRGSYGKVMLAELKSSNQYFAVKCLKKDVVLEDNDVECTMIEKKVLAMGSSHPYLCTLFCTFQSQSHLFFVMEYLSGGDLMFHIQQSGRFDQERARFYAAEIVCALKYLHKRGIVYRDAKLDNICLDAQGHIRLVDFGFCKLRIYKKDCLPRNLCGTPDYMAPEIIKGHHYNQSVDWWSFGVLLYEMLIGQSPFNGTDEEELFWSVCNEEAYYPRFLSKEAKHILILLLEKNPEKRLGMPSCVAGDIIYQPFFRHTNWEKVEKREVRPPFRPKLKSQTDVSNFDSDFTMEKAMLTPTDKPILDSMDQSQFQGFSYTNPRITD